MFGLGATEALIILVLIGLLFAPTVVAFFVGYTLGQRRGGEAAPAAKPVGPVDDVRTAGSAGGTPPTLPADDTRSEDDAEHV